jgi:hypothetical protein
MLRQCEQVKRDTEHDIAFGVGRKSNAISLKLNVEFVITTRTRMR